MNCPDLLRTQAYLDGELEGAAAVDAERHIEHCSACQAFSADAADLSDALRRGVARHRAPARLRARIDTMLTAETTRRSFAWHLRRRSFWLGAASGSALAALAAVVAVLAILPPSADTLTQSVVAAHSRALMRGRTIEIASSNHHRVKPWFAGRVALSPPVADFTTEGFKLEGGRIDRIAGSRAAVVVYRHGDHEIDLFVWPDKGSSLPDPDTTHGYRSVFWKRGDLDFAAVCDMDAPELHRFVDLVRGEPE